MLRRIEFALAGLLFALVVALVALAAVSRSLGQPFVWSVVIAQLLFVWLVMLAADLALQQPRHIGMTILLDRLPPGGRRAADFANTLVLVALLGFLLVYAVRNTILMHPRLIGATQMNASLVHASMVAGLLLMLRTLLADLCALVPRRRGA